MMERMGDRVEVSGAMTIAFAREQLRAGETQLGQGARVFDLARVSEVDSAGLSVVFGWQRAAARSGAEIRIANPPPSFLTLAELYGVADLLPLVD
jgi:phospholipid transport system transporter-binding protein